MLEPPVVERQEKAPVADIVEAAKKASVRASDEMIEFSFTLDSAIKSGGILAMGYRSWTVWWSREMKQYMSTSTAVKAAKVGMCFRRFKDEILKKKSEIGFNLLYRLALLIRSGEMTREEAMDFIRQGKTVKDLPDSNSRLDAGLNEVRILVDKNIAPDIVSGLIRHAVRNQLDTLDDAAVHMAISETLDPSLPKSFERFRPLIEQGRFFCLLCGKVPMQPTIHHVIPRSIGMGAGPKVLLCWQPCHESIVQPNWKKYARHWGYNVEKLIKELDTTLTKAGVLDEENDMDSVRTGAPSQWRR